MSKRTIRRTTLAIVIATGPTVTACELALDFDRSLLQPEYEAGAFGQDASTDAPPDRSTADRGSSTPPPVDAPPPPKDSGFDAPNDGA